MCNTNRTRVLESFGIYLRQNTPESHFRANPRGYGKVPNNSLDLISCDYIKAPTLLTLFDSYHRVE